MTTSPQYVPPPGNPGYGPVPPGYPYLAEPTSPRGEPLATFDKRLLAFVIDGAILGAAGVVIALPIAIVAILRLFDQIDVYNSVDANVSGDVPFSVFGQFFALIGLGMLVLLLLNYLYEVELALRGRGQTPGKKLVRVRIMPLDPAQTLTRGHLARRYFARLGLSLLPAMSWIDGLWQLWDKPYRQCLHDKAGATVVVRLST